MVDYQYYPKIAILKDGGYVVTWASRDQDQASDGSWGVYAQRFAADNTKAVDSNGNVNEELRVNSYTYYDQTFPDITALNNGGFVITWMSKFQDSSVYGIYAKRYAATVGVAEVPPVSLYLQHLAAGNEFFINDTTSSEQRYPDTTALNDGGFIITWESRLQDGSGYGIYAKMYNENGEEVNSSRYHTDDSAGNEFRINTKLSGDQED